MAAARYSVVILVLCCLSVTFSRPHEKKHKHKHRLHSTKPVVINDESKKDIVIGDESHHQELILPKKSEKDTNVNLAFDILTPNIVKKAGNLGKKETKRNYDVFLDQEAISFDSGSQQNEIKVGHKDELWHNLYEIKEPVSEEPNNNVVNKVTISHSRKEIKTVPDSLTSQDLHSVKKQPLNNESDKVGGSTKDVKTEKSDSEEGDEDSDGDEESVQDDEDEDGIEDNYDDYEDYNYFDENEGEYVDVKAPVTEVSTKPSDVSVQPQGKVEAEDKRKSLEDLINEVYGGVLPYSASIESIKKQAEEGHEKKHHQVVKKDKAVDKIDGNNLDVEIKSKLDLPSKTDLSDSKAEEDTNIIDLGENKKLLFHQDMLDNIKEGSEENKIKTTELSLRSTTTSKPLSTSNSVHSDISKHIYNNSGKTSQNPELTNTSKINPSFKTPNIAETSPNPPTTKATAITAAPVRTVKEFIQSKPLQLCIDDGGCSPGRMCHNGVCVCGEPTLCKGSHTVAVCGSDGQLYPSHCELHRQACLKQIHIRVNHNGDCGQNLKKNFEIQPTYQGTHCEYRLFKGQEGILWGDVLIPVSVKSLLECSDICDKKSYSGSGCFAFQYSEEKDGSCFLFEKPTDIIRHPNSEMDFYEQRRCKPDPDNSCDYEPVNLVADHIYAMCNVKTSSGKSFDECQETCGNCTAFTYRKDDKTCDIHNNKACIDMMDALGIVHYMKRCNEKGDVCHILEVIPGKSPFMCSKATSSVSSLIECHDACVHGRCEAFQYLTKEDKTTCEIFFDKSCIELLDKKKENYYVKRCTNPKDCKYHEIQSASMMPCRVTSTDTDTMEKCRNMCNVDECYGFMYNYDSLDCSLYSDQSCVLGRSLNYVIRKCKTKQVLKQGNTLNLNEVPTAQSPVKANKGVISDNIQNEADQDKKIKSTTTILPTIKSVIPKSPEKLNDVMCKYKDYVQFKSDLLRYHCVRFRESNCDQNQIPNKGYIASLMFSYYDRDMNGDISNDELWEMQVAENLEHISTICTLLDILKYENQHNKKLDRSIFLKAFVNVDAVVKEDLEVIPLTTTAGNGLEIKCGVERSEDSQIIWRRNNIDLTTISIPDMAVFSDGTLYFEAMGLHHTGNFTCYDKDKPGIKEVHVLTVNLRPVVTVSPLTKTLKMNNIDVFIDCHVDGIPQPRVEWEVNNEPLPYHAKHYITTHDNGTLIIHDSDIERDTGSYKCSATNRAGVGQDVAVLNKPGTPNVVKYEAFYVFHKKGYTAYQPESCETIRHVKGDFGNLKYIPEELDRAPSMCGLGQDCAWGVAVNVQNKYIYASQPEQNRVIIIDVVNNFNPVQFVRTDRFPVKLYYVEHLDEVWVLCWNSNLESGSKTVVVIRDASKDIRHHIVHTQPIGYRFDLVEDIFIPPQNDLQHRFKHGYVSHKQQKGLYKLDLETMRYTKAVDLESHDCVPKHLAFIPIGGYVVVECERPVQLILDYITDTVLFDISVKGTPYVSPDSRLLVFVNGPLGHVTVFKVADNGKLNKMFDVTTGTSVSETTFFLSDIRTGYDMFLACVGTENIYSVALDNGQVTKITGKNEAREEAVWPWSRNVRSIVSGDMFSQFIASPAESSIGILNGRDRRIHCDFEDLDSPDEIVYTNTKL